MPYSNSLLNKPAAPTFAAGSKNDSIFKLSAPYANQYQGQAPRWLFVCSAGLLRSPTGAAVAVRHGVNARSCGSNLHYALIPISVNLVAWAQKIIFVEYVNYTEARALFAGTETETEIASKALVLSIPDTYNYGDPKLQDIFEQELFC